MPNVVVVLGMHRSGTSALAGVLSALGYDFGPNLLPPIPGVNEKGFWEHADIVRVHRELLASLGSSWHDPRPLPDQWTMLPAARSAHGELVEIVQRDFGRSPAWGLKDPRLCRLLPLWQTVFDELGVQPRYVICHRDPYEVAASIGRRDGFSVRKSLILWLAHGVEAERLTRDRRRAFVSYDALLRDWRVAMAEAASRLKVAWPLPLQQAAAKVDAFLEPALRHHHNPAEVRRPAGEGAGWIETWSNLMETLAGRPGKKAALQAVHLGAQVQAALQLLGPELIGGGDEAEVAQVFYPQEGLYSEDRSLAANFRVGSWETLRFTLPAGALDSMASLRLDPCASPAVVAIDDLSLRTCTDPAQTLFRADTPALLDRLTVGGTARRLSEAWGFVMLSLGGDSQVFLPAVPVSSGPLELEVRLKIERVPLLGSLMRVLELPLSLVARKDDRIAELEGEAAALRTEAAGEREQVARLGQELELRVKLMGELEGEAAALRTEATHARDHAARQARQITLVRRRAVARQRFVSSLRAETTRLGAELAKTLEAAERTERLIAELTADREERVRIAQGLRSEVSFLTRQLDEIRTTGWWALGTRLARIRARLAPRGTRSAAVAWLAAFLGTWGAEGTRGVARRAGARLQRLRPKRSAGDEVTSSAEGAQSTVLAAPAVDGPAADPQVQALRPPEAMASRPDGGVAPLELIKLEPSSMASFASALSLSSSPEPVASVVVPVLNRIEYTLCCLASMCRTPQATSYEVIVVDDGSSDGTTDLLASVRNLRYLRNSTTLGFVRSANHGASVARGKYLLILHNDTQVQERWLDPLVQAFDADPLVGIAGSKLVDPSGHLQQAGTVIRNDGSLELVGLNDDPSKPEYNRLRQVDHCSGASLMIRRDLFLELGGFDEAYAPGFLADCDLSLKLRQSGRKVVYAPDSVVVHHSSLTADAGEDSRNGHGQENRSRLLERWRPALAEQERVRAIAFYLPQFHPIPDNDAWWGKGFTEWSNVARAKPVFQGHLQPRVPADLGFYDLRLPEVREAQAELAASHGLYGFCYYYYWFNGKRLLDRPLTEVLTSGKPDFPFCLCWANENWTRRWDGCETDVLIAQHHSPNDDRSFIESLLPYFADRRYVRIDGRPLLLVYRAELLPDARSTIALWREVCRGAGGGELYLGTVQSFDGHSNGDPRRVGFDAAVEFPPHGLAVGTGAPAEILLEGFEGSFYDYARTAANFGQRTLPSYPLFRTVMPSWDNTPRRPLMGHIFADSSPALYERWLRQVVDQTRQLRFGDERTVFINAWNEWGEGNYLEPDQHYGRAYLEATRRALGVEERREGSAAGPIAADRPE